MSSHSMLPQLVDATTRAVMARQGKPNGPEIQFRCPLPEQHTHGDRNPSASWNPDKGVWTCYACGAGGGTRQLATLLGVDGARDHGRQTSAGGSQEPSAVYDYLDEDGQLLFQVVRHEPKRFYQRRPDGQGGWNHNLGATPRVLYRLPELINADPSQPVFIVEGEKDANRLADLGLVATTNPQGAGKWREEYTSALAGRSVVLIADNDEVGARHVSMVAEALDSTVNHVRVLDLPGLSPTGDVSDWLDAGGTVEALLRLLEVTPAWSRDDQHVEQAATPAVHETTHEMPAAVPFWPDPPDDCVYQGFAGEIVRALEPHTEADPVALLFTLLAAVGNIVGTGPHWRVGSSVHHLRIFAVLVGPTSKGRKGTALAALEPLLRIAAPEWMEQRAVSGLSTGEGLIAAVRDPTTKTEPIKEDGRVVDYQQVITDQGVDDKRLFVVEEEFAATLKIMGRDGNILSPTIRAAWDDGNLRTLTKHSPAQATAAHISILGHITQDELLRHLTSTEAANGFANRFIWVCVRRSKLLPHGGQPDQSVLNTLGRRLTAVVESAGMTGLMERDAAANEVWEGVYGDLSDGAVGLLGAVTSRAEAQVMRLAALYALLDGSSVIGAEHLWASLALWEYVEDSVRYVFGDKLGDPVADTILSAVLGGAELTRTQIRDLLGRHQSQARINQALGLLLSAGNVTFETRETGGRPIEIWSAA